MLENIFFDIIDDAKSIKTYQQSESLLSNMKEMYGLSHIAYLGINIPGIKKGKPFVQCTYSDGWKQHYFEQKFQRIDPIVQNGLTNMIPQDWGDLKNKTPASKRLFNEASEFGIGEQGFSFPIRGQYGDVGIFCINSHLKSKEWDYIKKICMRDFLTLASFFHNGVLKSSGHALPNNGKKLSSREIEVLQWASEGKSAWITSELMNISERTVKFHRSNARIKLNCLTTIQAVAIAVSFGIIDIY